MKKYPRHWKPLVEIPHETLHVRPEVIEQTMREYNIDRMGAIQIIKDEGKRCRWFINDLYQVSVVVREPWLHICIRRRDGGHDTRDWRHFQQIKNEIAGEECEAMEIYPAESRKVDTSNKFHLWVLPPGQKFPVGWGERDVQYEESRNIPGLRQRPL